MKEVFIITLIVVAIVGILHYLFPIIQIIGDSMYPTYLDGEIIFGSRIFRKSKLKEGDVIIYRSPEGKIVIKRIHGIKKRGHNRYFYCLGDNSQNSYDSRNYGFISSRKIECRVINQRRKKRCMQ